jgi:AcrR family transcriptional regulator
MATRRRSLPAPKKTRADKTAGTRDAIRRAAWDLFVAKGYEATTTGEIAAQAGVAAGTIFVHASDKPDLLFLVMHERLSDAVEAGFASLPKAERAPLLERFLHVFRPLFAMYGEHPEVASAFVRSLPGARGPNALRTETLTFGFLHRLALMVSEAQANGEVARDLEPILCAQNVFGLYFMALMSWLSGHTTIDTAFDPLLRNALALQIRGFGR